MSIKIENGIPIPKRGYDKEHSFPFEQLTGDKSFLIPKSTVESYPNYKNFVTTMHNLSQADGVKVTLRKIVKGKDKGGVRVWRRKRRSPKQS